MQTLWLPLHARAVPESQSDPANALVWCSAKLGQTICTSLPKKSAAWQIVIDHLNPRFLNFKRKIDKETSVIFCAVGTELSSFIHLL